MAVVDVELYAPHPGQRPIHASAARFRIATCGRRFGKTMLCVNELAERSLKLRGRAVRTAWIAPFYRQTMIAFRWMCREFRPAFAGEPSRSELVIPWRSGVTTQFGSADNYDALRGEGYHFVVGDEFGFWPRPAWEEVIRPTLSDTGGAALLVGSPKGRNLFWELWARGQDRDAWPDYESWQLPTAANPFIPPSEIDEARESLPADVFRQEYEAAFLEDSAGVFRNLAACEQGTLEEPQAGRSYVLGWDPARKADGSVVTIADADRGHVVAWDRYLGTEYTVQVDRVAALAARYNHARVLMDSTGLGDPVLSMLRAAYDGDARGYVFTAQSKQNLVEHLAAQIERQSVTWPAALRVLRHELSLFQYETTRAGNIRYGAPVGAHDDAVISLALCAWAMRHAGGFFDVVREDLQQQAAKAAQEVA